MFSIETDRPTVQAVYCTKPKPYCTFYDLASHLLINYFIANFLYKSVVENDVNMKLILCQSIYSNHRHEMLQLLLLGLSASIRILSVRQTNIFCYGRVKV